MSKEIIEEVVLIEDKGGHVEGVVLVEEIVNDERPSHEAEVSVELLDDTEHIRHHFRAGLHMPLLHILDEGAQKLEKKLLPSAENPLDQLRGIYEHHQVGAPLDLEQTLGEFLGHHPTTHHFAIELVLAIRVNTRWRVATSAEMTPKAILNLFGLPWEQYTLYEHEATTELPGDTPIKLSRGECFEAQKDGKYGDQQG